MNAGVSLAITVVFPRDFSKKVVIGFDEAVNKAVSPEDLKAFKKVTNTILELINSKKIYL